MPEADASTLFPQLVEPFANDPISYLPILMLVVGALPKSSYAQHAAELSRIKCTIFQLLQSKRVDEKHLDVALTIVEILMRNEEFWTLDLIDRNGKKTEKSMKFLGLVTHLAAAEVRVMLDRVDVELLDERPPLSTQETTEKTTMMDTSYETQQDTKKDDALKNDDETAKKTGDIQRAEQTVPICLDILHHCIDALLSSFASLSQSSEAINLLLSLRSVLSECYADILSFLVHVHVCVPTISPLHPLIYYSLSSLASFLADEETVPPKDVAAVVPLLVKVLKGDGMMNRFVGMAEWVVEHDETREVFVSENGVQICVDTLGKTDGETQTRILETLLVLAKGNHSSNWDSLIDKLDAIQNTTQGLILLILLTRTHRMEISVDAREKLVRNAIKRLEMEKDSDLKKSLSHEIQMWKKSDEDIRQLHANLKETRI